MEFCGESSVWVGLGANLGDAERNIRLALERLEGWPETVPGSFKASSLYLSKPMDCPPGSPDYLNAVCCFQVVPVVRPHAFLGQLLSLEAEMGRQRSGLINESRLIDLDLLAFRREISQAKHLILPHPRAHLRDFVLVPMAEICPEYRLPGFTSTVGEMLRKVSGCGEVHRFGER